jgi:hypothetical protein
LVGDRSWSIDMQRYNSGSPASASSGSRTASRAGTERGLLLTCLWYIREVDPATLRRAHQGRRLSDRGR